MKQNKAIIFILLSMAGVTAAHATEAETCRADFEVVTKSAHGSLPAGSVLSGEMVFQEGRKMRMGTETVSYLSQGTMTVRAEDGTQIDATLRAIHLVRTPHFADYASFDAKDVLGDLGGVTDYEDPMLLTFYAPRGSLTSFDLPKNDADWRALSMRRAFQVHTPDTMQMLPGRISTFHISCD